MKFKWVVPFLALALGACGGTDFSVTVKGDRGEVMENLAGAEDGSAVGLVSSAVMTVEDDSLIFTVAAADGYDPAEVRFDFTQDGGNTVIDVAVDVPQVPMGADQYLSEWKVENELRKNMRSWAKRYSSGEDAGTSDIALTLALVAMVAQQVQLDDVYAGGGFGFAEFGGGDGWGSDTEGSSADFDTASYDSADYESDDEWSDNTGYDDGGWGSDQ